MCTRFDEILSAWKQEHYFAKVNVLTADMLRDPPPDISPTPISRPRVERLKKAFLGSGRVTMSMHACVVDDGMFESWQEGKQARVLQLFAAGPPFFEKPVCFVGSHERTALEELHNEYPLDPDWIGITFTAFLCRDTPMNKKMLRSLCSQEELVRDNMVLGRSAHHHQ